MKKDDDLVRTREGMYGRSMHAQHSDSDRRIMDTPGPSLRVFQVWKGNNVAHRSLSPLEYSYFADWDFLLLKLVSWDLVFEIVEYHNE